MLPELAWPWLLLALPLPWLALHLLPAVESGARALRVPGAAPPDSGMAPSRRGFRASPWLVLAWVLLCVAAARPQHLGPLLTPPVDARELMLAVDLSGSMGEADMRLGGRSVDRLTAVKAVLDDFLDRRDGDRIGLVVFGQRAYTLTPLTQDLATVRQQLADMDIGMAGRETAIGDAIALSVRRLRPGDPAGTVGVAGEAATAGEGGAHRVVVLLTDGVNNAGVVDPRRAAAIAASEGVRVHTIGFGGDGQGGSLFGLAMPRAQAEIDEAALKEISAATGGLYFRARATEELAGIYAELDRLEARAQPGDPIQPRIERYPPVLALALLMVLLALALPARPTRSALVPDRERS